MKRVRRGFLIGGLIGLLFPLISKELLQIFPPEVTQTANPISLFLLVSDIPALLIPFYREAATMTYHAIYLIVAWAIIGAIIGYFGTSKKRVVYGIIIAIIVCMLIGWLMFNRYPEYMAGY